jgi:ubiquinone/menaquinone biosynthesis C-methylase UbiE
MSEKSARELAFLRDLYIDNDWSARFTNILDENLILPEEGKFLYVEPGTGNHILVLSNKLSDDVEVTVVHNDAEISKIAEAKAKALRIAAGFHISEGNQLPFSDKEFSTVIADASLLRPKELPAFLAEVVRVADSGARVTFFMPTAGSYGEFFSLYWEALFTAGMEDIGGNVEELIQELPTVSQAEEIAKIVGLDKVKSVTKTEFFDYEDATKFMNSLLVSEFLMTHWMKFLDAEGKEKIVPELVRTIDEDREEMTLRLTMKATVINGKKV